MAYGIQLGTTNGAESIDSLRSAQVVYKGTKTVASGSQALPFGVTASQCTIYARVFDNKTRPSLSFSGNTVVWTGVTMLGPASVNFELVVLRIR